MTLPTLHIVFNMSAAVDMRRALAQAGLDDEVIGLIDNLDFGPINPPTPDVRSNWVAAELRYDWSEVGNKSEAFWKTAFSGERRRIAWTSRRSTSEYADFLEFVWRLGEMPCEIIDLTEVTISRRGGGSEFSSPVLAESLAAIPAHDIAENRLWDLAKNLSSEMRDAYRVKWDALRMENAALRVLDADLELVSAPISFFDPLLLSFVKHNWLKAARIIADTLVSFDDDLRFQTGDLVLASRLRALVGAGLLEGKGDLNQILLFRSSASKVRLSHYDEQRNTWYRVATNTTVSFPRKREPR